mmetsp:Transcript_22609/g.21779  ORF Transcript_22609/g.21779 Transcript_22609/m.21779 type:complete len:81 (-) Transcript_22609:272-514(-)
MERNNVPEAIILGNNIIQSPLQLQRGRTSDRYQKKADISHECRSNTSRWWSIKGATILNGFLFKPSDVRDVSINSLTKNE